MSSKTKTPPMHMEDCQYKQTGSYTVGCVGCVHQLILDSKNALTLEYKDIGKKLNDEQKKELEDKLGVFFYLEGMFP